LTDLPAANLTGTLPAISATNLTNLPAANLTGTLPAISGASLTGLATTLAPYFSATGGNQNVTDAVTTKLTFGNELNDSDNCYDATTNYRFTPTTAGRYFIMANVLFSPQGANRFHNCELFIYKNGSSELSISEDDYSNYYSYSKAITISAIFSMNGSSDYLEIYGNLNVTTGSPQISGSSLAFFIGA
jgi:hypothetical protein